MDLLIRHLSPRLFEMLRARAAARGRSVQDEALDLLEAGLEPRGEVLLAWLRGVAEPAIAIEAGLDAIRDSRAER